MHDDSRVLIHEISVHIDYQRRRIGKELVEGIARRFRERGVLSISVTVADRSVDFWKKLSFTWSAHLMLASIGDVRMEEHG